jgi:hypothetical protein
MHALRMLAREGFGPRVLDASRVSELERVQQLPEIAVIGDRVLYQVRYDPQWTPIRARRIHDPDVIQEVRLEITGLYDTGKPLLEFFHREITPLDVCR